MSSYRLISRLPAAALLLGLLLALLRVTRS
jgi:hypothetical protein